MSKFKTLEKKVIKWAEDRGILDNPSAIAQSAKTLEECAELNLAIVKADTQGIRDGLGDLLVTAILQAKIQGLTLDECLEFAYNEISGRKGKMVNGVFVKDE